MKAEAIGRLRRRLADDEPAYGLWVTLEAAGVTRMGVGLGLDWVVVDAADGRLDWRDILEHIRAAVGSFTVVLVRVAELNMGLIRRVLDIGADGVVVPWAGSAEQVRQAVAYAHYPSAEGRRGDGWGQSLIQPAGDGAEAVLVVPLLDAGATAKELEALVGLRGVELFFIGAGAAPDGSAVDPHKEASVLRTKEEIRRAGKHCGVVAADGKDLVARRDQGFGMLGVGRDGELLLDALRRILALVGRDQGSGGDARPADAGAADSDTIT